MADDSPSSIGPYTVEDVLGRGGMGVVYRAVHGRTGERVALKTVRKAGARELAGLRREIHALAQVRHPGIVRITSPAGKLLGTINLPIYGGEPKRQICSTNVAFGGADGRTLFIAGCDSVYTIQLKTPGIVPAHNVKK